MAGVYRELAPSPLFNVPPASLPALLPAPQRDFSPLHLFNIPPEIYHSVMDIRLPVTIASVYAISVWLLNRVNKNRRYKPWWFSRTTLFFCFVVAHNLALALFSGWISLGMFRAIADVLPSKGTPAGMAAFADALCKMHGPRGYGNAVFFDTTEAKWTTFRRSVQLVHAAPDPSDMGRLWNEGLAYYGWIFYLSKFYEVVDTMIILAKGKKSSLLQTYHHTGAMIGMWAGMRYMSPPIWCFVLVNSFIHFVMYLYYAASTLGVRVPGLFKRTLTTMQIMQLVFGASYALLHLIVAYDAPMEAPYVVVRDVSAALPHVTSSVSAAASSAGIGPLLKKLALRAAGGEGLAKNIGRTSRITSAQPEPVTVVPPSMTKEEIRYRWESARVHCIDTSGEVLAILLNVLYLIPLIYLFVRFFIRSYLRRTVRAQATTADSTAARLRASSADAVKGIGLEISKAMSATQGSYSDLTKTPTSSGPRSEVATPPTTSASRSGAGTPSTLKPLKTGPTVEDSTWLGGGRGDSKSLAKLDARSSSPVGAIARHGDEKRPEGHPNHTTESFRSSALLDPNAEPGKTPTQSNHAGSALEDPSTTQGSKPGGSAENSPAKNKKKKKKKKSKGAPRDEHTDLTESIESLDNASGDQSTEASKAGESTKPATIHRPKEMPDSTKPIEGAVRDDRPGIFEPPEPAQGANHKNLSENSKSEETHEAFATEKASQPNGLDEISGDDEANERMEMIDLEGSGEDLTLSSVTVTRKSSSPTPSEARRKADEVVRRAYEAADMATRKASEDDADSILSVETTLTIENMANESQTEARRYEIPGIDEALDIIEQEAERELQPTEEGEKLA